MIKVYRVYDEDLTPLIKRIKQHPHPPFRKDDIYYEREPWQKFGGVSSGICMGWYWYNDYAILQKATKEDMLLALKELEST